MANMAKNPESKGAVEIRQETQKDVLVEELRKRPIVQSACQKIGIGRATFYRWKKEDQAFAEAVDEALETGAGMVNDMAESQLLAGIRDGNMTAIIFWLKHHHRAYTTKVELLASSSAIDMEFSEEERAMIRRSVALLAESPDDATAVQNAETHDEDSGTTKPG
jgi:hypothetical protein